MDASITRKRDMVAEVIDKLEFDRKKWTLSTLVVGKDIDLTVDKNDAGESLGVTSVNSWPITTEAYSSPQELKREMQTLTEALISQVEHVLANFPTVFSAG